MKYITTNQLLDKFKHKDMLEISDLVQVIKDEFDVNVWIEEKNVDSFDIEYLAEDTNLFHQINKSRDDRKSGRVYDHQAGLEYLCNRIKEFEGGQNV
jgi:ribosomal protein L7/L12